MDSLRLRLPPGKYFYLKNRCTGLVLQVDSPQPGSPLTIEAQLPDDDKGVDKQLWSVDVVSGTVRSKLNGLCIDAEDVQVVLNPLDTGKLNQLWEVTDSKVQNRHVPSKVLDLLEGQMEPGSQVCVGDFIESYTQFWDAQYLPARLFYIQSILTNIYNIVLDVKGEKAQAGASLITWKRKGEKRGRLNENQLWYEDEGGLLRSMLDGMVPDSSSSTMKVEAYDLTKPHRQWMIADDHIVNRMDPKLALDIKGESKLPGADVVAYRYHGGENQRWKFDYLDPKLFM